VLFAVHTVVRECGFEAQEFTTPTPGVGINVGVMLLPSTLTAETPLTPPLKNPLGTYETTVFALLSTRTESELAGWQEPAGGSGVGPHVRSRAPLS
jgi:hypothetical protein